MPLNFFFVFFLQFALFNNCLNNVDGIKEEKELVFVYEHCRHGKRAPLNKKNGLFNEEKFSDLYGVHWEKLGQLTDYGKFQHYFLGLRNKFRYKDFIDFSTYDQNIIISRSTGVVRSKESLYYQLLGMFSEDKKVIEKIKNITVLNKDIFEYGMPPNLERWKNSTEFSEIYEKILQDINQEKKIKIDLNAIDEELFQLGKINHSLVFITTRCKNHLKYIDKTIRKIYNQKIKAELFIPFSKSLKKINSNLAIESFFYKNKTSITLVDQYISDYEGGRKEELKDFYKKTGISHSDYYNSCIEINNFYIYNIYCYSKSCIINVSRYMKNIIKEFDQIISNKTKREKKSKKMIIDAGHDNTINSFQILMQKAFDIKHNYCKFGCNIYFELYKVKNKDKYIMKYYDNDDLILELDYKQFKKSINKLLWDDLEIHNFCNDKSQILKIHKEQDTITGEDTEQKKKTKKWPKNKITDL